MKVGGAVIRRSYMEVPTMDERKWEKIPSIPADVFYLDIEDSVPPPLKEAARAKVVSVIEDPSIFGTREYICRPNNINTEWGRDDLEAIAAAHVPFVLYPKVRSVDEIREVKRIFEKHGATPDIVVLVETPHALLQLEAIASVSGVTGLAFGPGDLSMEAGVALLDGRSSFRDGLLYARTRTLIVARALGLEAIDAIFVADLKDIDAVKAEARRSRLQGFTGIQTFYPPHVAVINEVMTPSRGEVAAGA